MRNAAEEVNPRSTYEIYLGMLIHGSALYTEEWNQLFRWGPDQPVGHVAADAYAVGLEAGRKEGALKARLAILAALGLPASLLQESLE
jgi:hypothetical protein